MPRSSKGSTEATCILKISRARKHSFMLQWEEGEEERGPCPTSKKMVWVRRGQEIALFQAFPLSCSQMSRTCNDIELLPTVFLTCYLLNKMAKVGQTEGPTISICSSSRTDDVQEGGGGQGNTGAPKTSLASKYLQILTVFYDE